MEFNINFLILKSFEFANVWRIKCFYSDIDNDYELKTYDLKTHLSQYLFIKKKSEFQPLAILFKNGWIYRSLGENQHLVESTKIQKLALALNNTVLCACLKSKRFFYLLRQVAWSIVVLHTPRLAWLLCVLIICPPRACEQEGWPHFLMPAAVGGLAKALLERLPW